MYLSVVFLALTCDLMVAAITTLTPTLSSTIRSHQALATPSPTNPPHLLHDLRRRAYNPIYNCGYDGYNITDTCDDHLAYCTGMFAHTNAYVVCSTAGVATVSFQTTAITSWQGGQCPTSVLCCPRYVESVFYIASGYTVTALGCGPLEISAARIPDVNILDPPKFSASLAQIRASASASSSSTSSASDTSSGLSPGGLIGLRVGLSVVGLLFLVAIGFAIYSCIHRGKDKHPDVLPQQQGLSTSHSEQNFNHNMYAHASPPPQWSPLHGHSLQASYGLEMKPISYFEAEAERPPQELATSTHAASTSELEAERGS